MVCPTMSGMMLERRDQVLMTFFSPLLLSASTLRSRCSSTKGPFFSERGMSVVPHGSTSGPALAATPDDVLVGGVVALAGPALGLAPRGGRVATAGAPALTPAKRVVDGVHGHAAGLRTDALPAVPAGLADLDQLVLGVADLAHRG